MAGFRAETQAGAKAAFGGIAAAAAGAGAAVGGIIIAKATIDAAKGFESQLELIKTQAGASKAELGQMHEQLLKMASQVGATPEELAKGLYHIESAGLHGAKALEALRAAAEGAAVGHTDLESVTNALVAATNSHIAGITSQVQSMGVLNAIVGAGNMRMGDLTASMSTGILPAAHTFGLRIQDVGAAIATMTNAGVPAIDAATRLRMTFSLLAAPTGKAAKELASIGLTSKQLAIEMRSKGLLPALEDLKAHLEASGKSATDQAALLSHAFGGGRSSGAIMTLLGNLDSYQARLDQITKTTGNFGQSWADTQKTAEFQSNKFKASLDALKVMIGDQLLPAFVTVTAKLTDWTNALANNKHFHEELHKALVLLGDGFKAIGDIIKTIWGIFGQLSDVLGGTKNAVITLFAVLAVGKFVAIAAAIRTYLIAQGAQLLAKEFQVATAEVEANFGAMELATIGLSATIKSALITTGVGALVVAVGIAAMLIITHFNTVKKWLSDFGTWIKDHAAILLAIPIIGEVVFMVTEIIKHWTSLKNWFVDFAKDLALIFTHPVQAIKNLFFDLEKAVVGVFKSIAGVIGGILSSIPTKILGVHIPGASEIHSFGAALKSWADGGTQIGAAFGANLVSAVGASAAQALTAATSAFSATSVLTGGATGAPGGRNSMGRTGAITAGLAAVEKLAGGAVNDDFATKGHAPNSFHYKGEAADLAVNAGVWARLFAHKEVFAELFGPWGLYHFGVQFFDSALQAQHMDHIHVAYTGGPTAIDKMMSGGGGSSANAAPATSTHVVLPKVDATPLVAPAKGASASSKASAAAAIATAKESLSEQFKALTAHASQLGTAMSDEVRGRLKALHAEIQNIVTKGDVTSAKEKLAALSREITKELSDLKARLGLIRTFDSLKVQVAKLGTEVTPQIRAEMKKIQLEIATASTPQSIAKVRADMTKVQAEIKAQIAKIKTMIESQRASFTGAWDRMLGAVNSSFDKATTKMLAGMTAKMNAALSAFDAITQGNVDAITAQFSAPTAAEAALKALTDAKAAADIATQEAADRKALVDAQASGDAAAILAAQQQVNDDVYNAKVRALTEQAALERAQANKDMADAIAAETARRNQARDDLAKTLQDQIDAFSESRALLQTQMDDRIGIIEAGMESGKISAADGMVQLIQVLGDPAYGVELENTGLVIGGQLYSGINKSFGPIFDLIHELQAELKSVGELAPAGTLTVTTGTNTGPPDVIERLLAQGNKTQEKILDAVKTPAPAVVTVNSLGQPMTPLEIARQAAR